MPQDESLQEISKQPLTVIIKTKADPLFNGTAHSVTSVNSDGPFDILPQHANFITLVRQYIILDNGMASEKKIEIERGLLYVMSNKVEVYVGV